MTLNSTCLCVSVCSGPEVPVLDYQTQQLQLFPLIAAAYALTLAGQALVRQYVTTQAEIEQGNFEHMQEVSLHRQESYSNILCANKYLASNPTYTKG